MAKQYGMVIDTTRCMGCQTCVGCAARYPTTCPAEHLLGPRGQRDSRATRVPPDGHLPEGEDELPSHAVQPLQPSRLAWPTVPPAPWRSARTTALWWWIRTCASAAAPAPRLVPLRGAADRRGGRRVDSKCTLCFDRLDNRPCVRGACRPARPRPASSAT